MSPHSFVIIQTQGYEWFLLQPQFLSGYENYVPLLKVVLDLHNTLEHFNMLSPLVPVIMIALHWWQYIQRYLSFCRSPPARRSAIYMLREHNAKFFAWVPIEELCLSAELGRLMRIQKGLDDCAGGLNWEIMFFILRRPAWLLLFSCTRFSSFPI